MRRPRLSSTPYVFLEAAGFRDIVVEETGDKYLAAHKRGMALPDSGAMPALGVHLLAGERGAEKIRNSARNIEEGRTQPVLVQDLGRLGARAARQTEHLLGQLLTALGIDHSTWAGWRAHVRVPPTVICAILTVGVPMPTGTD